MNGNREKKNRKTKRKTKSTAPTPNSTFIRVYRMKCVCVLFAATFAKGHKQLHKLNYFSINLRLKFFMAAAHLLHIDASRSRLASQALNLFCVFFFTLYISLVGSEIKTLFSIPHEREKERECVGHTMRMRQSRLSIYRFTRALIRFSLFSWLAWLMWCR